MSNLIGQKFGKLTVIEFDHYDSKYRYNFWKCVCDCGKQKVKSTASLRRKKRNTLSCGCLRKEMLLLKCDFGRKEVFVANINSLYRSYQKSAKERDIEFLLEKEDFINLTSSNCIYCNIKPFQIHNKKDTNGAYIYNGIDRVDNNIGYILLNCVPCCKICNYAKRQMTEFEFIQWISKVYNFSVKNRNFAEDLVYYAYKDKVTNS